MQQHLKWCSKCFIWSYTHICFKGFLKRRQWYQRKLKTLCKHLMHTFDFLQGSLRNSNETKERYFGSAFKLGERGFILFLFMLSDHHQSYPMLTITLLLSIFYDTSFTKFVKEGYRRVLRYLF